LQYNNNGQFGGETATGVFDSAYCNTVGYIIARTSGAWTCSGAIPINVVWLGADPAGGVDSSTAFGTAETSAISTHAAIYVPAGDYKLSAQLLWNIHTVATQGINMYGDGRFVTALIFDTGVSSPNLEIVGNPGDSLDHVSIRDMRISGNINGNVLQIGRDDLADAANEFQMNNLFISNGSSGASALALKLNYFLNGYVNVVANGGGYNAGTKAGSGLAAVECNQCKMSTFLGSYSLSGIGIYLTNGFNQGNTFQNTDTELHFARMTY
jgi:hypothetical protein